VQRTGFFQKLHRRLSRRRIPASFAIPSAEFQRALCESFAAQDTLAIESAVARHYRDARVEVAFERAAVRWPMSCAWSRSRAGESRFTFPDLQPGHVLNTVVSRWLALFELFLFFDRSPYPAGRIVINFNDAGLEPGLAFSGENPDYILIPDSDFFRSRGYAKEREYFARHLPPWNERAPTVFWRGSSLGQKHHTIANMPRARLCQIANAAPDGLLDAAITDVFDVSDSDAAQLRAMGLIKPRVSWKELGRYRYHIDIDGHANTFAGLFRKLLSGGLVLKVGSPNGYAQWYYDRLKPWENFVPVHSDLSDLLEVAAYCRNHDDLARRIAHNGRRLALSLTFENEFKAAVKSVRKAFAQTRSAATNHR
jgi:hypothetical protein